MSIKKELNNFPDGSNSVLDLTSAPHPKEAALEQVQQELNEIKDSQKEERFYWISAVIVVFDIFTFQKMSTWGAPISITVLEIIVLICLARKFGVKDIWTLTEKLIGKWNGGSAKQVTYCPCSVN